MVSIQPPLSWNTLLLTLYHLGTIVRRMLSLLLLKSSPIPLLTISLLAQVITLLPDFLALLLDVGGGGGEDLMTRQQPEMMTLMMLFFFAVLTRRRLIAGETSRKRRRRRRISTH